jgi:hypothetical protein
MEPNQRLVLGDHSILQYVETDIVAANFGVQRIENPLSFDDAQGSGRGIPRWTSSLGTLSPVPGCPADSECRAGHDHADDQSELVHAQHQFFSSSGLSSGISRSAETFLGDPDDELRMLESLPKTGVLPLELLHPRIDRPRPRTALLRTQSRPRTMLHFAAPGRQQRRVQSDGKLPPEHTQDQPYRSAVTDGRRIVRDLLDWTLSRERLDAFISPTVRPAR